MAKEQTIYFTKQKGKNAPIRKEIELVKKKPKIAIESEKDLKRKLRGDKKPLVVEIPSKVSKKLAKELKDTAERQPKSLDYLNKKYASGTSIAKIKEYNALLKKRGVDISNILEKKRKAVEEKKGKEVQLPPEFYQLIKALKPEAFAREQLPSEKQEQERKELQIQADFINTLEDKIDNPDVQKQIASQFAILKTLKEKEKLLEILKKSDTSKVPPKIPKETKAEKAKEAEAEAKAEAAEAEAAAAAPGAAAEAPLEDLPPSYEEISKTFQELNKEKFTIEDDAYSNGLTVVQYLEKLEENVDLFKSEADYVKLDKSVKNKFVEQFKKLRLLDQRELLHQVDKTKNGNEFYNAVYRYVKSRTTTGKGLKLKKEKKVKGGALLQEVGKSRNDSRKSYQSYF